jgi:hypothetical protein
MTRNQQLWLIIAVVAGFALALFAFRRTHRHGPLSNVPLSARPRYMIFGEYYDPYAIWPYGSNSNYSLFLTNSGIPTTGVPSPGTLTPGNFPQNPVIGGGTVASSFGGNGIGAGVGGGRGH